MCSYLSECSFQVYLQYSVLGMRLVNVNTCLDSAHAQSLLYSSFSPYTNFANAAKLNSEMIYVTKQISLPIHTCMHGVKKATKFETYAWKTNAEENITCPSLYGVMCRQQQHTCPYHRDTYGSMSLVITSPCPHSTAWWRGVMPFESLTFLSAGKNCTYCQYSYTSILLWFSQPVNEKSMKNWVGPGNKATVTLRQKLNPDNPIASPLGCVG